MVDPRMPTDPIEPPYADHGVISHIAAEIRDHLWPWSQRGFLRNKALQAAGVAIALAVTLTWILAAMGRLEAGAIIAGWFGWSVFEVMIRMSSKPYVKEGPWWGRRYRRAKLMDMICYVSFKNLLIGTGLFIALKSAGLLII